MEDVVRETKIYEEESSAYDAGVQQDGDDLDKLVAEIEKVVDMF